MIAEVSSTTVDSRDLLLAEIWLVKVVCLAMYIRLITRKNLPFSYVLLDTYLPYSTVGYLELQFGYSAAPKYEFVPRGKV